MYFIVYFIYLLSFCEGNDTDHILPVSYVNYLENVTIQDILDSGINENDKIEKKLLDITAGFTTSREDHSSIEWTDEDFSTARKSIPIDLGSENNVSLYNLNISLTNDHPSIGEYSTFVRCDSVGNASITVTLSNILVIRGSLIVNYQPEKKPIRGTMFVTLRNTIFSKNVTITSNGTNLADNSSEISYDNLEVRFSIDKRLQKYLYSKVENILQEIENWLKQLFIQKLTAEINTSRVNSLASSCATKMNIQNKKKIAKPFYNDYIYNNLYVISTAKSNTWKEVIFTVGPIVIEGLSHFNTLELSVAQNAIVSNPHDKVKDLRSTIKTGQLKGKFEWRYEFTQGIAKNRTFVNYFSIDFLKVESLITYHGFSCFSNLINTYSGEVQMSDSKDFCENENFLVNSFLSEYLTSIIKTHLESAIETKFNRYPSLSSCPPSPV